MAGRTVEREKQSKKTEQFPIRQRQGRIRTTIQCRACGEPISLNDEKCPECGTENNASASVKTNTAIMLIVVLSVWFCTAVGLLMPKIITDSAIKVNPGDVFESDSLRISYFSCDSDWKGYGSDFAPLEGNKIIKAYFVLKNIGEGEFAVGIYNFKCYADGKACDSYYVNNELGKKLLAEDEMIMGYVYFEVPKDAKSVELKYYASDLEKSADNQISFAVR